MKIPIRRISTNVVVGEVAFKGGEIGGSGYVRKTDAGTNQDIGAIRDAIVRSKGMSAASVYTEKGHVKIWHGFWGWLSGLRLVLPSVGYDIPLSKMELP